MEVVSCVANGPVKKVQRKRPNEYHESLKVRGGCKREGKTSMDTEGLREEEAMIQKM